MLVEGRMLLAMERRKGEAPEGKTGQGSEVAEVGAMSRVAMYLGASTRSFGSVLRGKALALIA